MKNNFLPIPDAPGYEVNSQGFVRNIRSGKILKSHEFTFPNIISGEQPNLYAAKLLFFTRKTEKIILGWKYQILADCMK